VQALKGGRLGANPSITEASAFNAPALVSWKEPIERRVLGATGMRGSGMMAASARQRLRAVRQL
jgi:hypothetical protein